jgi:hypothetical protein
VREYSVSLTDHAVPKAAKPVVNVTVAEVDDIWVVFIDSDENEDTHVTNGEPQMRIYLNEACLYENPKYKGPGS